MKRVAKIAVLILLIGFIAISSQKATSINVIITGSWDLSITANDLVSGAGSELKSIYESNEDAITIDITQTGKDWRIDIHKEDTNWPSNFHLYVKRTSGGSGISGGTTYQEVTDVDTYFFGGEKRQSGINVQLKLSGVSLTVPPNSYITTVIYTVTEI